MVLLLDFADTMGFLLESIFEFLFAIFKGWFIFMILTTLGVIVLVYFKIFKYYIQKPFK